MFPCRRSSLSCLERPLELIWCSWKLDGFIILKFSGLDNVIYNSHLNVIHAWIQRIKVAQIGSDIFSKRYSHNLGHHKTIVFFKAMFPIKGFHVYKSGFFSLRRSKTDYLAKILPEDLKIFKRPGDYFRITHGKYSFLYRFILVKRFP